jgi:ketosteroid isomerase-like protein
MATDVLEFVAAALALDQAFAHHAKAGEIHRLVAAYYAEDALVLPPNLPRVQGHGQIRELFREMLDSGAGEVIRQTTPLHVAEDLGYGVGTCTCAVRHSGGGTVRDCGKHLLVYRRQADRSWKVAADMFSSDLPSPSRLWTGLGNKEGA